VTTEQGEVAVLASGVFGDTATLMSGAEFVSDRSGSQVYVSRYGAPLLDLATGSRQVGAAMSVDSSMVWLCCSKPVLLVALVGALAEHGLDEESRVAAVVPEFAAAGKADVRISHLLTHTVPYRTLGLTWTGERVRVGDETSVLKIGWEAAVALVCATPLMDRPGRLVTYTAASNWLVLAEVLQRLTGRAHEDVVAEHVLDPLGMAGASYYLTPEDAPERAPLWMCDEQEIDSIDVEPWQYSRWPGLACRGPARDMAKPIECVAGWRRPDLLGSAWRAKLIEPRRSELGDPVFQGAEIGWSLGLCADPVAYGLPLTTRAAGHTGAFSSFVVADLDTGITVSFLSSRLLPKARDWSRKRALIRSIYRELGLPCGR
jgi:CubicO group peptidase (beta-lactamase class C family)